MLSKINSKTCTILLFIVCIIISAFYAYTFAVEHSQQVEYVPVEKIVGAEPRMPIETVNMPLAIASGSIVFLLCATLSALVSELYYCALTYFRKQIQG